MPARIAIATCREYPALCDDDRLLLAGLAAAGICAEPLAWNAEVEWPDYAAVLLRSTWDYHLHAAAFSAWLDGLERARVPCWNPASLVRWNMDKRYLRDLSARGIPTVPTLWIEDRDGTTPAAAADRIRETGWDDVVVKPTVSASAWRTIRLRRDELARRTDDIGKAMAGGGLMAQPFLPEILDQGELSLLFFDGAFSHAVVKRPKAGDFRVQWTHGGGHLAATPPPSIVEQGEAVLDAAPSPGLYARVDGIVRDGRLVLTELEQIESYLFFAEAPGSVDRLVRALRARL